MSRHPVPYRLFALFIFIQTPVSPKYHPEFLARPRRMAVHWIVDWRDACFSGRYRRKLNHLLPIPTIFTTNWLAVIHKTISTSPRYSALTDPWTTDVRTAGIQKRLEKKLWAHHG
ncbi:hypothetical protein C8J56DRAFT_1065181 [Mycena floridula]|nr:hypothetical protein C8J56DRAFT_1065181 [Mycena floridula]